MNKMVGEDRKVEDGRLEDPLLNPPKDLRAAAPPVSPRPSLTKPKTKTESLTIRVEDEVRISEALANAAKKQTTGAIYSIKIDVRRSGTLGIGVKDLHDKLLAVSMLKRAILLLELPSGAMTGQVLQLVL